MISLLLFILLSHLSLGKIEQDYAIKARLPSDEEKLMEMLLDGYNPSARPVLNSSHTVTVQVRFSLLQIQDLNLRNQVLTTTGLLILDWVDERLRWDEDQIALKDVVIEARKLWRPEFASINGADGIYGDYGQFRALVKSNGSVHWEPGGVFKTVCEIDITYYPFDEQNCELKFGAWSYHTTKMNLTSTGDEVNKDSYEQNGEWEISSTKASRGEFYFACCENERFSNVNFELRLRRRYTFYVMNVILPSMMTSVLLLSIFFCTPAQKVQIGVVVLLSFRIFLLNVTDSIPKTSDHIPLLGIYLTLTMAITTLSMVLTVFILNLHHITDRPVPTWAKILVLKYLARLMCMCSYEIYAKLDQDPHIRDGHRISESASLGKAIGKQLNLLTKLNGSLSGSKNARMSRRFLLPGKKTQEDKKKEEEWTRDWRLLAEVVDRLFFWIFLSAIVITTLLLFHPLTKGYFSIYSR